MQRRLLPAGSLAIVMSSMGLIAACAGRTLEPYDQGIDPSATATGTTTGTPTGTVTGTSTTPPDTGPPPNPSGTISGTITGDPGCPSSLSGFNQECKVAGAVCDVNLSAGCAGTKLRYMCVRYDSYSPGYWTEALHPSLECSCPTSPPKYGTTCEISLYRECAYPNPKCPNDPSGRSSYSCVDYGNGKGYWSGYEGYCYYNPPPYPDSGPYPYPWDGGGGWADAYPPPFDAGPPMPPYPPDAGKPTPSGDAGKPKPQ